MIMDDRISEIVSALTRGTKEGKLEWQKTEREKEYMVKLDHGIITVDNWSGYDEETGDSYNLVDVGFLSKNGEVIDRVSFNQDSSRNDYQELINLHEAARRNNLKVDKTLDEILGEIQRKVGIF